MATCRDCGGESPVGARYCVQCGHSLAVACPACGAELPTGARFCPACGKPLVRAGVTEERKLVTILFADIVDSTQLGERLDPEPLRSLLDSYFSAMAAVVEIWGGTVEKFIGDAIVAAFGLPAAREDDAERALRSALGMQQRLVQLNDDLQASHGVSLKVRIGVNSGEVLAAVGARLDQDWIAGDAVNVAARLEAVAQPGAVVVGERTYQAARGAFRFSEPSKIELKGKSEPVVVRRLLDVREEPRRGIEGLHAKLVGREAESRILTRHFDEVVRSGKPRFVTVLGSPGVGKSRLVREFARLVRGYPHSARTLRGRCLAAGEGVTYGVLAEMLRAACGISLDDVAEVSGDKLRTTVAGMMRSINASTSEIDSTVFALATTVGITLPDNPLGRASAEAVSEELAWAWPRFATAYAAAGPCLFLVEDLHWASDALVEMLERIVARARGPLLVVATARPELAESHPKFSGGGEGFASVTLGALTEQQSQSLFEALLLHSQVDDMARAEILSRADGNPYYLEEILQHLIENGALVSRDGRWYRAAPVGQSLPLSLHALLAARIDALAPEQKRVLQEAAVVGGVFWLAPLARRIGDGKLSATLRELERRGLILARPTSSLAGQAEFSFKHALLRDVAYASVPKARRAQAHAEVGKWIEEMAADRREEFAELLAYHYQAAASGDGAAMAWPTAAAREPMRVKAFESLVLAGAVARRRGVRNAVELHAGALALATSAVERCHAHEEIGDDYESVLNGDDAVGSYREALRLVSEPHDRVRLLSKIGWLMAASPGAFRQNPDGAVVEQLIAEAEPIASDELSRGALLAVRGVAARLWRGSEPFGQGLAEDPVPVNERINAARAAMEIARRRSDPNLISKANEALRLLYGMTGRYDELASIVQTQLGRLDQEASRIGQADVLRAAATINMEIAGRYEDGLELARRSYALSQEGNAHPLMHATHAVLFGLYHLGRWRELMPVLGEHEAAFREDPATMCRFVRDGPVIGAIVCSQMGEDERSRALADLVGDPRDDLENASAAQAILALERGDASTAMEIAMPRALRRNMYGPQHAAAAVEALTMLCDWKTLADFLPRVRGQVPGNALLEPICVRAEGLLMAATGNKEGAAALLWNAVRRFETFKVPFEVARTKEHLTELVSDATAMALREAALNEYERLGAVPYARRARASLAR